MKEVKNILRILRESDKLIEEGRPVDLKNLSNQTVHSATISQDPDNIIVAVLIYSLSKAFSRKHYKKMEGWDVFEISVKKNLGACISSLEKNDVEKCRTYLGRIRNSINRIDGNLSRYIEDIFTKAKINKAFKMYEHGLSSEQTAKLLGISLWDMASYIGQSSSSEAKHPHSMPIKKRVKMAEDFFS